VPCIEQEVSKSAQRPRDAHPAGHAPLRRTKPSRLGDESRMSGIGPQLLTALQGSIA
jgi:hypothetical protein